jgi:Cdc6-like AAA superfamily ATPase
MFEKINFKYTDAEEETLYAPELIEDAYVDINNIIEQIQQPENYLVIGPKGAGKTALSSKLLLMAKPKRDLFVDTDELEQFEFNLLAKTGGEKGTSIGGALTVWQMILAIRLMPLFLEDDVLKEQNKKLVELNNGLIKYGLTGSDSIINIVQYTSRRGIFGKLKSIISEVQGEKVDEEKYNLKDPAAILEAIKQVLSTIKPTESQFFLVLDGLDHPLRKGRSNVAYIADLINAVRLLNMFFCEVKLKAKIVILIREEILQIVPDPNLNKRINDNGIELKWYDNTRDPLETSLLKIIEKRARLAGYNLTIKELWKLLCAVPWKCSKRGALKM